MEAAEFTVEVSAYIAAAPHNRLDATNAMAPEFIGLQLFEPPIIGFARADDDYFTQLRAPAAIGPHFRLPQEWLPSAQTVVAFFFPFTERVKAANRRDAKQPAPEWMHARIEGQAFLNEFAAYWRDELAARGYPTMAPFIDANFSTTSPTTDDATQQAYYTSNWSERHIAYACGLGTFGLSKGLITRRGVAGRFSSLVTTAEVASAPRPYAGIYDYCTHCGKCAANCPAGAISLAAGKLHSPCREFVAGTQRDRWFGCGKCQVNVPCENQIPRR